MRRLNEPSHLDLCCLQKPIIIACGNERVNNASGVWENGPEEELRLFYLTFSFL